MSVFALFVGLSLVGASATAHTVLHERHNDGLAVPQTVPFSAWSNQLKAGKCSHGAALALEVSVARYGKDCYFLDFHRTFRAESTMYAPGNPELIEKVPSCRTERPGDQLPAGKWHQRVAIS
eukprot:SAG31_NODE_22547_length_523_cov_0.853774_1_plen_121_part_10